mgnify:CR=1 FL=1
MHAESCRFQTAVVAFVLLFGLAGAQAAPKIQSWKTANGAQVFFVPAP